MKTKCRNVHLFYNISKIKRQTNTEIKQFKVLFKTPQHLQQCQAHLWLLPLGIKFPRLKNKYFRRLISKASECFYFPSLVFPREVFSIQPHFNFWQSRNVFLICWKSYYWEKPILGNALFSPDSRTRLLCDAGGAMPRLPLYRKPTSVLFYDWSNVVCLIFRKPMYANAR